MLVRNQHIRLSSGCYDTWGDATSAPYYPDTYYTYSTQKRATSRDASEHLRTRQVLF